MEANTEYMTDTLFLRARPSLTEEIDAAAAEDQRERSVWIRMVLEERLALRKRGFEPTIKALMSQPVAPR